MKKRFTTALISFVFFSSSIFGQSSDLEVFGYFQGYYNYFSDYSIKLPINPYLLGGNPIKTITANARNSFLSQQLNLFFKKDFSGNFGDFTTFVNLELTANYSSNNTWGAFNLQEAWLKYNYSDALNFKFGAMIPVFNNLNEIKNRTPLFPYMFRPMVYEVYASDIVSVEDFLPEQAFFQIYGKTNVTDDVQLNFAGYVGNAERSYVAQQLNGIVLPGLDTSKFKTFGTRIGIKVGDFKFGVSGTVDRDNKNYIFNQSPINGANLSGISLNKLNGDLPRIRMGADFSFNYKGIFFESEMISVKYDLSDDQKTYLENYKTNVQQALVNTGGKIKQLSTEIQTNPSDPANTVKLLQLNEYSSLATKLQSHVEKTALIGKGMDKMFWYAMLGYNVMDDLQVYAMYNYLHNDFDVRTEEKVIMYSFGLTFSPVPSVLIKGQYIRQEVEDKEYSLDVLMAGFSVFF